MNDPAIEARLLRAALGISAPESADDALPRRWERWVDHSRSGRVVPLLHRAVHQTNGVFGTDEVDQARSMQLDVMAAVVQLEHTLLDVDADLSRAGFRFAVLKGSATAHLDYETPALRQFSDIDLLVSPDDFEHAQQVLAERGWARAYPLPRHHERFTHAATLRRGGSVELDLHQQIAHRALGRVVPTDQLLADTVGFHVAARRLPALSDRDRLIHAAIHATTSRGPYRRLSSVADVLVLATRHAELADEVLGRAASWGVYPLVIRATTDAFAAAQLPLPAPWSSAISVPGRRRSRMLEWAYPATGRRPLIEELAFLRVLPSWRDRADYVSGYFRIDADYSRKHRRAGVVEQGRYLWSRLRANGDS